MTAVIHHGAPGSYKTFSIIQNVLVEALQAGRVVITNIRGFDSVEKVKTALSIELPDTAQIWYIEPDDSGFRTMATFFHWAPAGALIAMDEGQRIYPTRSRRFDHLDLHDDIPILDASDTQLLDISTRQPIMRPKTVEIAFDQHRHFNWDIYISTPNISKIHKEIRLVVEWAYRHRNNSGLLPWMKNTWTEFRHDAENNGKSISHYSGSPKRYKAQQKYFACYESTATGTAKNSNENISIFRDSRLRAMLVIIALSLSYLAYSLHAAYNRVQDKIAPPVAPVTVEDNKTNSSGAGDLRSSVDVPKTAVQAVRDVDPLSGAVFYFTGSINAQLLFEAHVNNSVLFLNYDDLRSLGYFVMRKTVAYVALQRGDNIFYAFNKPHVAPTSGAGEPVERERGVGGALGNSIILPSSLIQ